MEVSDAIGIVIWAKINFSKLNFFSSSCIEVNPGDEILSLLQTTTFDVKEFEREAACLPPEDGEQDVAGAVSSYPQLWLFMGREVECSKTVQSLYLLSSPPVLRLIEVLFEGRHLRLGQPVHLYKPQSLGLLTGKIRNPVPDLIPLGQEHHAHIYQVKYFVSSVTR